MSSVGTGVAILAERGDEEVWLTLEGEAAVCEFAGELPLHEWPDGLREAVQDRAGNLTRFELAAGDRATARLYADALERMSYSWGFMTGRAARTLMDGPTGTRHLCDECGGSGWSTQGGWPT